MKIKEVNDKKTQKAFLELPLSLYKKDPNFIRPLDNDVEFVFDAKKNKYFRHGECIRWISGYRAIISGVLSEDPSVINRKFTLSFWYCRPSVFMIFSSISVSSL